jgi:2'-5' RNA ligase
MIEARENSIIIPTSNIEPNVKSWREKYDSISLHGIPSHITILSPFKKPEIIDDKTIEQISSFFSKTKQFEFNLINIRTWPGVIYLEPHPVDNFIELIKEIGKIFPENPHPRTPHLTIGNRLQNLESAIAEISQDLAPKLPIKTLAAEAWLMESKNGEWSIREKFPFAL